MNFKKINNKNYEIKMENWELMANNIDKDSLFENGDSNYVRKLFEPIINNIIENHMEEFSSGFYNYPVEVSIFKDSNDDIIIRLSSMSNFSGDNPFNQHQVPVIEKEFMDNVIGENNRNIPTLPDFLRMITEKLARAESSDNNEKKYEGRTSLKELVIEFGSLSEAEKASRYLKNISVKNNCLIKEKEKLYLYIELNNNLGEVENFISEFILQKVIIDSVRISHLLENSEYIIKKDAINILTTI